MERKRSHREKTSSYAMSPGNFMDKLSYEVRRKLAKVVFSYSDVLLERGCNKFIEVLETPISKDFVPVRNEGNEFNTMTEAYQYVHGIVGNRVMKLDIQRRRLFLTQSGEMIEEEGESLGVFIEDTGMKLDTVLIITKTVEVISAWEQEVEFSFELYNGIE